MRKLEAASRRERGLRIRLVNHPFNLCVFSFLFVFTYDTLRDVSGDMHHPRHRFITAVGTRTTRTSPRSFLVFARHNCLSVCLCLSFCLASFPSPAFSLFVSCLFCVCVCLCGSLFEHLSDPNPVTRVSNGPDYGARLAPD